MPNIRVICPACKTELEIDSKFEGKEVECGSCLEVFIARAPSEFGSGVSVFIVRLDDQDDEKGQHDRRPRRRRRRLDDDDDNRDRDRRRRRRDDDDYAPPPPRSHSGGENGLAVASLILGILSIFPGCCCDIFTLPFSVSAIVTGAIGMQQRSGREMATAGLACGVISVVFIVLRFFIPFGLLLFNPAFFR